MRKEGRRRSKAGLKFDFSGGEAEKPWESRNKVANFCCRRRCPICRDVTATEGKSRTIGRICQEECQQEDIGRGDLNCLSITLISYLIIFNQWTEKRSERLKKPTKVTRGKSNLSSWKVVKNMLTNNFDQQSWQCYCKYSSGRDKHEVLEEMTSHLGDSSTKPTDKGQVGFKLNICWIIRWCTSSPPALLPRLMPTLPISTLSRRKDNSPCFLMVLDQGRSGSIRMLDANLFPIQAWRPRDPSRHQCCCLLCFCKRCGGCSAHYLSLYVGWCLRINFNSHF